jgi:putative transposase
MDLIQNQTFRLLQDSSAGGYPAGIYRVILDEPVISKTVCVCIQRLDSEKPPRRGRPKIGETKSSRRKAPSRLIGELAWMERDELSRLHAEKCLITIEIAREAIYFLSLKSPKDEETYQRRRLAMAAFLDLEKLRAGILVHHGLGGLVRDTMAAAGVCRAFVYKQWSTLCRLGISDVSLLPRRDRCGAPNVPRPCDPGGKKKPGRKTRGQRLSRSFGAELPPKQPGMSSDWRHAIIAADNRIKTPVKPAMPQRYKLIIDSVFVKKYKPENGNFVAIDPKKGEYPNRQQVRRVLEVDVPRLEHLRQKTTIGHFKRSLRGLLARNWKGVAGPGHTWAIDSTVGDIYLRSSLNRAWIVGRPIVYIIVDIWSTAIVGFYVCLTGPSWSTAKISLFNSVADPALLGEMWGYQPILSLNPAPTLCHQLMCDRGEYLSKGASLTAIKIDLDMAFAPPYRPDLKGLVEVLHRIAKDTQFLFEPGAMDARRAEYDLRKSHPEESALTVREYVQCAFQRSWTPVSG